MSTPLLHRRTMSLRSFILVVAAVVTIGAFAFTVVSRAETIEVHGNLFTVYYETEH